MIGNNSLYRCMFVCLLTIGILLYGSNTAYAANTNCDTATNINVSSEHCQALLNFYDSTNGQNWYNNQNWDTDSDICSRYGITCQDDTITSINLTNNNLEGSASLVGIDTLQVLYLNDNQLTSINLSDLINLQQLSVSYNNLTTIHTSNLDNLQGLYLYNNQLVNIDLSDLVNLQSLSLSTNQLTSVNLSDLVNLEHLSISYNNLSSVDVSDLVNLKTLYLNNNQLTTIDLSGLSNLQHLSIPYNNLSSVDVSDLVNLQILYLNYNQLTNIDLSNLVNLQSIEIGSNQLTSLDITNNPLLYSLIAADNKIQGDLSMFCNGVLNLLNVKNNLISGNIPVCLGDNPWANNYNNISYNLIDLDDLSPIQESMLDSYFYNDNWNPITDRRHQYKSSDLSITQTITMIAQNIFTVVLNYLNIGPKIAQAVQIYYHIQQGISITSSDPYTQTAIEKEYGVQGDVCYDSLLNNTGSYRSSLQDRAGGDLQGFLEEEVEYGPGISEWGIEYIGDGSDIGKFIIDLVSIVYDDGFVGFMNNLEIDITSLQGCGTEGTGVYARSIDNIASGESGSISIQVTSSGVYDAQTLPSIARIQSDNQRWLDLDMDNNMVISGSGNQHQGENNTGSNVTEICSLGGYTTILKPQIEVDYNAIVDNPYVYYPISHIGIGEYNTLSRTRQILNDTNGYITGFIQNPNSSSSILTIQRDMNHGYFRADGVITLSLEENGELYTHNTFVGDGQIAADVICSMTGCTSSLLVYIYDENHPRGMGLHILDNTPGNWDVGGQTFTNTHSVPLSTGFTGKISFSTQIDMGEDIGMVDLTQDILLDGYIEPRCFTIDYTMINDETYQIIIGGPIGSSIMIQIGEFIIDGVLDQDGRFTANVPVNKGQNNIKITIGNMEPYVLSIITPEDEEGENGGGNGGEDTSYSHGGLGQNNLTKDICPNGDLSLSYYDGLCEKDVSILDDIHKIAEKHCIYNDGQFSNYRFNDVVGTDYEDAIKLLLQGCLVHGYRNSGKEFGIYNQTKLGEMYKVFARLSLLSFNLSHPGKHWSYGYQLAGEKIGLWNGIDTGRNPEDAINQTDLYQVALNYLQHIGALKNVPPIIASKDRIILRGSFAKFVALLLRIQ